MASLRPSAKLGILDFDIETRLVGFYQAGRFKPQGSEPIAIAAGWADKKSVSLWTQPQYTVEEMLDNFLALYDVADQVTGHYIRKFDLPILNGMMVELGRPMLSKKLVQDTKTDLKDFAALSKSQENLAEALELLESKYHMNDPRWRAATRLTPKGVALTKNRVVGDVKQHKELRLALVEGGYMNPPTYWRP